MIGFFSAAPQTARYFAAHDGEIEGFGPSQSERIPAAQNGCGSPLRPFGHARPPHAVVELGAHQLTHAHIVTQSREIGSGQLFGRNDMVHHGSGRIVIRGVGQTQPLEQVALLAARERRADSAERYVENAVTLHRAAPQRHVSPARDTVVGERTHAVAQV